MINYNELIESLDEQRVKELMEKLGVPLIRETSTYLIYPTACHNEDINNASHKLYYYKDNKFFYCYTSCQAMSIFKFLKNFYEERGIIYNWHEDVLCVVQDCANLGDLKKSQTYKIDKSKYIQGSKPVYDTYPESILNIYIKSYPQEWLDDNISKETMDKFNILYSISQNKIIIPHYDVNGKLIGIRGRALNQIDIDNFGKYMPVCIEGKWYSHSLGLHLYGLDKNKEAIKETGVAIICEAEKSVLQAESFHFPNVTTAVCGSNLNKYQVKLLLAEAHPKEIILAFDNEEQLNQKKYFNKLCNICKKYSKFCKFSFIYDYKKLTQQKDSPTDRGEDIFFKLLKERIRVK